MIYTFRTTTVEPGGYCLAWFPKGGDAGAPTLPAGWQYFHPAKYYVGDNWARQWAWGIKVPTDATPGSYSVNTVADGTINITVVAPTVRPWKEMWPHQASRMQQWLNDGYNLELFSGDYAVPSAITLPVGCQIKGNGEVKLVRSAQAGQYGHRMFIPSGGFTLENITLTTDTSLNAYLGDLVCYIHVNPAVTGPITIRDCRIWKGDLSIHGVVGTDMLVEGCTFERGGCTGFTNPLSAWINNDFYGPSDWGRHSFFNGGQAIIACSNRFHRTARGMVIQTSSCVGSVYMDTHMYDIRMGQENAGECFLIESPAGITPDPTHGFRDNLVLGLWLNNCTGPGLILYGTGMHDNIFLDMSLDADNALNLSALGGGTIGGNLFSNMELKGTVVLIGDVEGQQFLNFVILDTLPRRGNTQGPFDFIYALQLATYPWVFAEGAGSGTHTFDTNCSFVSQDKTYQPITSLAFRPA